MDVTATVDVKNASFKGISLHVKHDKNLNHSNKDIDFDKTKFNVSETLISFDEIKKIENDLFKSEFSEYNEKQKASGHKSRMKKDVHQYVMDKSQSFDKTVVATFANKQIQDKLLEGKSEEEKNRILELESKALADYAKNFNERNVNIQIAKYITNVDESTPHVHAQIIGAGDRSEKGKLSISFSNMIKRAYRENNNGNTVTDSRQALSWWRKKEDQALVDSFNKFLSPELGIDFNLYRTGEHIADFDSYKRIKEVNEHDKALEYIDEIKYYDPNHVVDKPLLVPIIEKSDEEIEKELYKDNFYTMFPSIVHMKNIPLDPKENKVLKENINNRKELRKELEDLAQKENDIPKFNHHKNKKTEKSSKTNFEERAYIINDNGKVTFKDQIKKNDDGDLLFKEEKKSLYQQIQA
ncbi:hypothetical protein [Fructilactobacillus frigidiflavus]|uniref:hypothetical protein n=1 Tax=Fructilactobacillus frigidiflavus TaxID=3242688 RepID=UPI003757749D